MSDHGMQQLNASDFVTPVAVENIRRRSMVVGVVATIFAAILGMRSPEAFHHAYLLAFMAWLGVSLGALGLLLIIYLTNGRWGLVIRRILEAAVRNLWMMALLFLPLYYFVPKMYVWAKPEEVAKNEHLQFIANHYLTQQRFLLRAAIYFAIWIGLSLLFTRYSREEDVEGNRSHRRLKFLAAPGAILFAFAVTFAAIDWVMSLDPQWTSTIYGLIFLVGQLMSALCITTVTAVILSRYKPMSELLHRSHLHDYGKLMLTFTLLWSYFSFSQWLIMWAGNLPDEITWYWVRLHGGWQYVSLFIALGGFAFPFLVLLSAQLKKDPARIVKIAGWLIVVRFVDLYWLIMPNFSRRFEPHALDILVPLAMGGFWLALFFRNLKGQVLLPLHAPLTRAVLEPAHE